MLIFATQFLRHNAKKNDLKNVKDQQSLQDPIFRTAENDDYNCVVSRKKE